MQPNQLDNQPVSTSTPSISNNKSSKLPWTCAIIMSILAIAGIGFGVYAFMDSNNKSDTISALETKVKTLNETINKLQENATSSTANTSDTVEQQTTTNDGRYIYISELGIKIKKPDNWQSIVRGYEYSNGWPQAADSFTIRESDQPGDGVFIMDGNKIESDCNDDNTYCVKVENDTYLITLLYGELTPGTESPITEEFLNFVTNSENYSKI